MDNKELLQEYQMLQSIQRQTDELHKRVNTLCEARNNIYIKIAKHYKLHIKDHDYILQYMMQDFGKQFLEGKLDD